MAKYRPSCGTEGAWFIETWCGHCERDKHQDCPIVAATFCYDVDDPEYPAEWVHDEGSDPLASEPKCTAFIPLGDPLPKPRCTETADLFAQEPAMTDTPADVAEGLLNIRGVLTEALAFVLDHADKDEDPEQWTLTRELRRHIAATEEADE